MNRPAHPAHQSGKAPTLPTNTEAVAIELYQLAFNALASASWHIARGEPTQAMSRIKRAQAHLAHSMESRAVQ